MAAANLSKWRQAQGGHLQYKHRFRRAGISGTLALILVAGIAPAIEATPPVGSQYLVDETHAGFSWSGPNRFDASNGYGGHMFWTWNQPWYGYNCNGKGSDWGRWEYALPVGGYYEVQAHIPDNHAYTRNARYQIRTQNGTVNVGLDQSPYYNAWVGLGTYYMGGGQGWVHLDDGTGEACATTKIGYDAVRWIYRGQVFSGDKQPGSGSPGDRSGPNVNSAALDLYRTSAPFTLTLTTTIDDRSTGGSSVTGIRWRWRGRAFTDYWFGGSSSFRSGVQIPISVFGPKPEERTALEFQARDAAGNYSTLRVIDYQLPRRPVYLALGDSYASGHHVERSNDINYGYPAYLVQKLPRWGAWWYEYLNLAQSGAASGAILAKQVPTAERELRARSRSWNIVTVSSGANDTDFFWSILDWELRGRQACPLPVSGKGRGTIQPNNRAIFQTLTTADVRAKVFATGYANAFADSNRCFTVGNTFVQELNAEVSASTNGLNVVVANPYSAFRAGGRSGQWHPYIQVARGGFPHPYSHNGHRAIADVVYGRRFW